MEDAPNHDPVAHRRSQPKIGRGGHGPGEHCAGRPSDCGTQSAKVATPGQFTADSQPKRPQCLHLEIQGLAFTYATCNNPCKLAFTSANLRLVLRTAYIGIIRQALYNNASAIAANILTYPHLKPQTISKRIFSLGDSPRPGHRSATTSANEKRLGREGDCANHGRRNGAPN